LDLAKENGKMKVVEYLEDIVLSIHERVGAEKSDI
jgi:hypothetical protein